MLRLIDLLLAAARFVRLSARSKMVSPLVDIRSTRLRGYLLRWDEVERAVCCRCMAVSCIGMDRKSHREHRDGRGGMKSITDELLIRHRMRK